MLNVLKKEMNRMVNKNNIVCEHGINDMPYGWTKENKWNKIAYDKWRNMLIRTYSEKWLDVHPTYIDTTITMKWHWLSGFVEDITKIDGYEEEIFLNGKLELDKDIKTNGNNKKYSLNNCMFVTKLENINQANKTRDNEQFKGENNPMYKVHRFGSDNPMYGKNHSEETKKKMSETRKGMYEGEKNPRHKEVAQFDFNGNLIKIWKYIGEAEKELKIYSISACCRGKRKSAGGFIWKYVEEI